MYLLICDICQSPFKNSKNGLKKVCSKECRIEFKRKTNRDRQAIKRQDADYRIEQAKRLREWRLIHRDEVNTKARERYDTDAAYREECKQEAKNWHRANLERHKENCKHWSEINFDKVTSKNHHNRTSWDLNPALVKAVYEYYHYTCVYCGKYGGKLSIEHILPIKRGGTDDFENLAIACRNCNPRKGKKTILEYALYLQEIL